MSNRTLEGRRGRLPLAAPDAASSLGLDESGRGVSIDDFFRMPWGCGLGCRTGCGLSTLAKLGLGERSRAEGPWSGLEAPGKKIVTGASAGGSIGIARGCRLGSIDSGAGSADALPSGPLSSCQSLRLTLDDLLGSTSASSLILGVISGLQRATLDSAARGCMRLIRTEGFCGSS